MPLPSTSDIIAVQREIGHHFRILARLEFEEARYISLLKVQPITTGGNHDNSLYVFNSGTDLQDERAKLYETRQQIYACNNTLRFFINDLKKTRELEDVFRAMKLRGKLHYNMMWRHDQLLLEAQSYMSNGTGQVQDINVFHARRNCLLATDINRTFGPGTE
ncbi:hypothetical protein BGW39_009093 [Mortierella sp. 14UC]|nr:hypothetical protein BGW39_009093 [Mortierella sp. 14UC]